MSRSFRVWDNQAKSYDWDREFVLSSDGNLMELRSNHNGTWDYHFADEDRFIVEQDTGLKDKNGESISEGDIVKIYKGRKLYGVYLVQFDGLNGEYMWCKNEDLESAEYGGFPYWAKYLVIGNIHENPELLEN